MPLLEWALRKAKIEEPAKELDLVAVTYGPGLMGSLLVGVMTAKALSQAWELPLVGVNHLEGHLFANLVVHPKLDFPFLCAIVSGGHTEVLLVKKEGNYLLLGATRDDAAGEAYDKVAKLLGLPYPGGPEIDRLAAKGDPFRFAFPVPLKNTGIVEFSFSGLKTAVLWAIQKQKKEGIPLPLADLAASFQFAVVEALCTKMALAVETTGVKHLALSGGVAANSALREALKRMGEERGWEVFLPPLDMCTDNAVMIAAAGYSAYKRGRLSDLSLSPNPSSTL